MAGPFIYRNGIWRKNTVPNFPVEVIEGHPLAPYSAYIPGVARVDLAGSNPLTVTNGSPPAVSTPYGPGMSFDGTSQALSTVAGGITGTTPFVAGVSMFVLVSYPNFSAYQRTFTVGRDASFWNIWIQANTGGVWQAGFGYGNTYVQSSATLSSNTWYALGSSSDYTTSAIYRDGNVEPIGTSYSPQYITNYYDIEIGRLSSHYGACSVAAAMLFPKALSAAEHAWLAAEPFTMLRPKTARRYYVVASGGGTSVALTGLGATSGQGTLGVSATFALTGQTATAGQGTLTPVTGTYVGLTGLSATSGQGTLTPVFDLALTGLQATAGEGTVAPAVSAALTGQAATAGQGSLVAAISVAVTGLSATGEIGSVAPLTPGAVGLTGQQATSGQGTLGVSVSVALTGLGATAGQGTVTPAFGMALTGQGSTAGQGSLVASMSLALTGLSATGGQGSVVPSTPGGASLTGQAATAGQGTLGVTITVQLTGLGATLYQGNLTPFTFLPEYAIAAGLIDPGPIGVYGEIDEGPIGTYGRIIG